MHLIQGVYDGNAVRPLEYIDWKKNQKVSIIVDEKKTLQPLKKYCGKVDLDINLEVLRDRK